MARIHIAYLRFEKCHFVGISLSLSLSLSPLGRSYLSRFWTSLLPPLACTEGLYFLWLGMMADEVTDRLENMKFTTEEEEVIVVSDEERKDEIESCE